jgi:hypothetical protein
VPDSGGKLTSEKPVLPPPTPPKEGTEPNSMKTVGRALDQAYFHQQPEEPPPHDAQNKTTPKASAKTGTRTKSPWRLIVNWLQQRPTSLPNQSRPTPATSPTRKKIEWSLIIGGLLMFAGVHHNTNEPPSHNPMDLPVRLGFSAAGLWMWVNYWINRQKWGPKWISLAFAMLLASGVIYLGYRIQSNVERNKSFGNVLRGFADEAEKSIKSGTPPKFNPPGDKALDSEVQVLNGLLQEIWSVMGRMEEELDNVSEKPVFDPLVLSSKASVKTEVEKRIESQRIIQKWQPELPRLILDAIAKKVESYNRPDKQEIIRGIESARPTFVHQSETICNLRDKKEAAELAFLSFMVSNDYQFKDGKVRFTTQATSQQYLRLAQSIKDNDNEMEAWRQQSLSKVRERAAKFGQ